MIITFSDVDADVNKKMLILTEVPYFHRSSLKRMKKENERQNIYQIECKRKSIKKNFMNHYNNSINSN